MKTISSGAPGTTDAMVDLVPARSESQEASMGSLSPIHWVIVLVIVLLVFGPGRLAGVGKGLGEGIRSFKKGLSDDADPEKKDEDPKQLPENKST
jgi:sec-independent protein translocase protein TatA